MMISYNCYIIKCLIKKWNQKLCSLKIKVYKFNKIDKKKLNKSLQKELIFNLFFITLMRYLI